jgi:hypothetical protein
MKIQFPTFSFVLGLLLTLAFSLSYECTVPFQEMIGHSPNQSNSENAPHLDSNHMPRNHIHQSGSNSHIH